MSVENDCRVSCDKLYGTAGSDLWQKCYDDCLKSGGPLVGGGTPPATINFPSIQQTGTLSDWWTFGIALLALYFAMRYVPGGYALGIAILLYALLVANTGAGLANLLNLVQKGPFA